MKAQAGIHTAYFTGDARSYYKKASTSSMLRDLVDPNLLVSQDSYDAIIDELSGRIDTPQTRLELE